MVPVLYLGKLTWERAGTIERYVCVYILATSEEYPLQCVKQNIESLVNDSLIDEKTWAIHGASDPMPFPDPGRYLGTHTLR